VEAWRDLKAALKEEFTEEINASDVHDKLRRRTKRRNESYSEYCYKMKDIAAKIIIDEKTVIKYIIKFIKNVFIKNSFI